MAELCRYAGSCPVCNGSLSLDPRTARRFRTGYCVDDWQECARFAVAREAGPAAVPMRMLPTDHTVAYEILSTRWTRRGASPAFGVFGH
jgi:hypothetical protein